MYLFTWPINFFTTKQAATTPVKILHTPISWSTSALANHDVVIKGFAFISTCTPSSETVCLLSYKSVGLA